MAGQLFCSPRASLQRGAESSNESRRIRRFVVLGLAVTGLLGSRMFFQEGPKSETAMTGCSNKGSAQLHNDRQGDGCKNCGHRPSGSGKTLRQHRVTLTGKLMPMGIAFLRLVTGRLTSCKAPENSRDLLHGCLLIRCRALAGRQLVSFRLRKVVHSRDC